MVEYERHRNTLYMDSKYDSYNYKNDSYNSKNDFSVERYRPYRSSRNCDELKYSHKLNESNYRDNIYSNRSRSRSRSTSRSRSRSRERYAKEKYSRYERSKERHFKLSNKSKLYYNNDEVLSRSSIRYDQSNYDYERTSRSPSRRSERNLNGRKLKSLVKRENVNSKNSYDKEFVERSFSIKRSSPRNDKENKSDYGKSKLIVISNCSDSKSISKKSLLGNGPENLRIYPLESEKPENHRVMCEETVLLMNSQCKQSPSSEKIYEYITNKSTNSILVEANVEIPDNHNTIIDTQIIDYNHEDISYETPVSLNLENTLLESDYIKEETPSLMPSFHEFDSHSCDNENILKINEHIDNQIKSLAELLTTPVEKEIKWNLIPLFAPIRKRISEEDIDIKSCSEYDPRIAHIVQNLF